MNTRQPDCDFAHAQHIADHHGLLHTADDHRYNVLVSSSTYERHPHIDNMPHTS